MWAASSHRLGGLDGIKGEKGESHYHKYSAPWLPWGDQFSSSAPSLPWYSASPQPRDNGASWSCIETSETMTNKLFLLLSCSVRYFKSICQEFCHSNEKSNNTNLVYIQVTLSSLFFMQIRLTLEIPKTLKSLKQSWSPAKKILKNGTCLSHGFGVSFLDSLAAFFPQWYFQILNVWWTKVHQGYFNPYLALLRHRYTIQNSLVWDIMELCN
jgi:hypothetical protein